MNYSSKKIVLMFLVLQMLVLSGCWDREELNSLGIAGALAVEEKGENVELTFEIYNPIRENAGGKEEPVKIIKSSGTSFFDAIRNTTLRFDKKIYFSHVKVIIVSEGTARKGLSGFFDLWIRQHQPRLTTYILVAKDVSPAEIISTREGIEDSASDYIASLARNMKSTGKTVPAKVLDFMKGFYEKDKQPIAGLILKKEEVIVEGAAVFSGDKLTGFLNGLEARGLNFITGNIISGVIVSPSSGGQGKNSVEIIRSESRNDVVFDGTNIKILITINILGALAEESAGIDTREPGVIKKIESNNSQAVKLEVEHVIKKAQKELKLDIFGFGNTVHKKYPEKWDNIRDEWNELFAKAEIEVEIKTSLPRVGLSNIPADMEER